MAVEIITSFVQQTDSSGNPMSGAKVYVYNVGTTTLRAIYTDPDLASPAHDAANPIVCDSAGRHAMRYTATGSYKIVVKTSADVTVYTCDNIDGRVPIGAGALAIANGGTGATDASGALANLGAATAAELADVAADVAALAGAAASTEKTHIATGTTGQRPATPVEGDIRRNTTIPQWEGYNGAAAWEKFLTDVSFLPATQSDQQTGSSTTTYVSPGRQQFHDSAAKFWLVCDSSGTLITPSYNVTSISDTTTGVVTVTIATDFSDADYAITTSPQTGSAVSTAIDNGTPPTTGVFRGIAVTTTTGTGTDPARYFFHGFGRQ